MTNTTNGKPLTKSYDLAERTALFGEAAVRFSRTIPRDAVTMPLISQFIRSATSIGANYLEADEAGSKKEFRYRISLCRRESRESQYWLRLIVTANPESKMSARTLWQEARELVLILSTVHRNSVKSSE